MIRVNLSADHPHYVPTSISPTPIPWSVILPAWAGTMLLLWYLLTS